MSVIGVTDAVSLAVPETASLPAATIEADPAVNITLVSFGTAASLSIPIVTRQARITGYKRQTTMMRSIASFAIALLCTMMLLDRTHSFTPIPNIQASSSTTQLQMNWLKDMFDKAFSNDSFASPPQGIRASARHILVKTPEEAFKVMDEYKQGNRNFSELAQAYSTCPSAAQGGNLGSFPPGAMVPPFDKAVFDPNTQLGQVVGPVETKFGYHLIVVDKRTGV
jgi:peptidyl-prolyl cis-trans isomerase C